MAQKGTKKPKTKQHSKLQKEKEMILKGYDVKRKNMKETDVPHNKMVIQAHKIKVAHGN